MSKRQRGNPCNDVDCPFWAWKDGESKVCLKPGSSPCPLISRASSLGDEGGLFNTRMEIL